MTKYSNSNHLDVINNHSEKYWFMWNVDLCEISFTCLAVDEKDQIWYFYLIFYLNLILKTIQSKLADKATYIKFLFRTLFQLKMFSMFRIFFLPISHWVEENYPILDTRISVHPDSSVTLVVPPLDSEMGWTGELWSNCKFLILEN